MSYRCKTWTLTKVTENLLRIAQRTTERAMRTLQDRLTSTSLEQKMRLKEIGFIGKQQKLRWG